MQYTLDLNTWRCGGDSTLGWAVLGKGETQMLNDEGYRCCLGQFAKQQGVRDKYLLYQGGPSDVVDMLKLDKKKMVYDEAFVFKSTFSFIRKTQLSNDLILINDDTDATIEQKIEKIRSLLEEHGHSLTVIPLKEEMK